MRLSLGASGSLVGDAVRRTSIFGIGARLNPSMRTMSASATCGAISASVGGGPNCLLPSISHACGAITMVLMAPARACRSPSVLPSDGRRSWWVCFTVITLGPRAASKGMSRSTSVVLPEFFHPTMPTNMGGLPTGRLACKEGARLFEVGWGIDVEERIDVRAADDYGREVGDSAPLRVGEAVQRAHVLLQRLGDGAYQVGAPEPGNRVTLAMRRCDRARGMLGKQRRLEARDEVERQEGAVDRHAGHVAGLRRFTQRPGHAGVQAGERPCIALDAVGYDRQATTGKARRVAVSIDDDAADLRTQAFEDMQKHRLAADVEKCLFAPAHA